jgi:hypothetical protein
VIAAGFFGIELDVHFTALVNQRDAVVDGAVEPILNQVREIDVDETIRIFRRNFYSVYLSQSETGECPAGDDLLVPRTYEPDDFERSRLYRAIGKQSQCGLLDIRSGDSFRQSREVELQQSCKRAID